MFKSAKSNKISGHIIEQIREAIFKGQLKPGDKLPPERELMKNFKVSKATLREALRSLEVLGFLEIRKGVSGGAFVTEVKRHIREVEKDLLTAHKEGRIEEQKFNRIGRKKESIPIFSMRV
jgi:DNA-binding FadR family transcriptional regulator